MSPVDKAKQAVKEAVRDPDKVGAWIANLSGPAMSGMLVGVVCLLTWGIKFGLWTGNSENIRATYVGLTAVVLAMMLGVVIWSMNGVRPNKIEFRVGQAEIGVENERSDEE